MPITVQQAPGNTDEGTQHTGEKEPRNDAPAACQGAQQAHELYIAKAHSRLPENKCTDNPDDKNHPAADQHSQQGAGEIVGRLRFREARQDTGAGDQGG